MDWIQYVNYEILNQAKNLVYIVKDDAPSNEEELLNSSTLVIWSGGSEKTIYNDKTVNYAFRALHDEMHLKTGFNFSIENEIELGRLQASKYTSSLMQELVFCEIAGQAMYFQKYNKFLENQYEFTLTYLKSKGVI